MANEQQVAILRQGAHSWQRWKAIHPTDEIDLSHAELAGIDLTRYAIPLEQSLFGGGVNLANADLSHADLRGANLWGADLRGAILIGAVLCRANLAGANLQDAQLAKADLRQAKLLGAVGLTQSELEKALGDTRTILPEAVRLPATWVK